jgi:hypothetical protein
MTKFFTPAACAPVSPKKNKVADTKSWCMIDPIGWIALATPMGLRRQTNL